MAIQNFKDKKIQNYFETGKYPKNVGWKSVGAIVKRKLDMLNYAAELNDLKSPPSNHLEALKGDLKGF